MAISQQRTEAHFKADTTIFREGDAGEAMFIIKEGSVKIIRDDDEGPVIIAKLHAGEVFGEMAVVDGGPRSATAVAVTDVVCIQISKAIFQSKIKEIPRWMQSLYALLVDRLRAATRSSRPHTSNVRSHPTIEFIYMLLERGEPDEKGRPSIIWDDAIQRIAYTLDIPQKRAELVLNVLSLTKLAAYEIDLEAGKRFYAPSLPVFGRFAEYCKEVVQSGKSGDGVPATSKERATICNVVVGFIDKFGTENDQAEFDGASMRAVLNKYSRKSTTLSTDSLIGRLTEAGLISRNKASETGESYFIFIPECMTMKKEVALEDEFPALEAKISRISVHAPLGTKGKG